MSDHEVSKPSPANDVDDAAADESADAQAAEAQGAEDQADQVEPDQNHDDRNHDTQDQGGQDQGEADQGSDAEAAPSEAQEGASSEPAAQPDHAAVAQSANEALAEAERAADDATAPARSEESDAGGEPAVDPDLAAFEEAEAAYPGTFGGTFTPPTPVEEPSADTAATTAFPATATAAGAFAETAVLDGATTSVDGAVVDAPTQVLAPAAGGAYAAGAAYASAATEAPLPIFVQAPEPPRERGNRGAIFGIGVLAAVAFAILYLGTALGLAAVNGQVGTDSIGTFLLDQVRSAGLWVPVAVFAIGFWLLGGIINRGRWGFWVVFGIIVGAFAYGGHLLGAIGSVEFWKMSGSQVADTVNGQLLAPLAIAAFVFGRELTIWFGAWAARLGRRRIAQNEEAQREYERVLEAGPQLPQ